MVLIKTESGSVGGGRTGKAYKSGVGMMEVMSVASAEVEGLFSNVLMRGVTPSVTACTTTPGHPLNALAQEISLINSQVTNTRLSGL